MKNNINWKRQENSMSPNPKPRMERINESKSPYPKPQCPRPVKPTKS